MARFEEYQDRYTRAALRREDGVLEIRLHDGNGGSLVWDEPVHRELPELFERVSSDPEVRVVILAGSGESFCSAGDASGWPEKWTPETFATLFYEGRKIHENLLAIEAPVIGVVNGPATWHAEIPLLSDVVLAAEDVVFQDFPHFPYSPPSDAVHTVWPALLGPNRGRYFLLMKEQIDAREAQRLGLVGEVLPKAKVLERAWEIARNFAAQNPVMLRYSRLALTHKLKRDILQDHPFGMALVGLNMLR
jgi:enoyl-CoA hydratase/carnithine racemase